MKVIFLTFVILALHACTPSTFNDEREYRNWIFSDESGYLQRVTKNNLQFQITYIPPNLDNRLKDSSSSKFDKTIRVFQFKITPQEKNLDLLKKNIKSQEEYLNRIQKLEHQMGSMFTAFSTDTVFPVFTHYENFRGLKNEILVHVHFLTETVLQQDLHILLQDKIYNTGNHSFTFDKDKINNTPTLKKLT